jgi:hypothetical protein
MRVYTSAILPNICARKNVLFLVAKILVLSQLSLGIMIGMLAMKDTVKPHAS